MSVDKGLGDKWRGATFAVLEFFGIIEQPEDELENPGYQDAMDYLNVDGAVGRIFIAPAIELSVVCVFHVLPPIVNLVFH